MSFFESFPKPIIFFRLAFDSPTHIDDYRSLPRPFGSIIYVNSGHGFYETPDGSFEIFPNEILFVPPGGTYLSRWEPSPEMFAVHFELPTEIRKSLAIPASTIALANNIDAPIYSERRYFVQKLPADSDYRDDFRIAVAKSSPDFDSLERFYRICGRIFPKLRWEAHRKVDPRILDTAQYIESHCTEPLTIEFLADRVKMSQSNFYKKFKSGYGTSPIEYRHRMVTALAIRYLTQGGDLSLYELSELLGFESEGYFRRVFKSVIGVSPREFIKSGGI